MPVDSATDDREQASAGRTLGWGRTLAIAGTLIGILGAILTYHQIWSEHSDAEAQGQMSGWSTVVKVAVAVAGVMCVVMMMRAASRRLRNVDANTGEPIGVMEAVDWNTESLSVDLVLAVIAVAGIVTAAVASNDWAEPAGRRYEAYMAVIAFGGGVQVIGLVRMYRARSYRTVKPDERR